MGKLTDLQIKSASPGKHTDGHGLYLLVTVSGGKLWRYDYRFAGKRKTLALGQYPTVRLLEARQRHLEAIKKIEQAIDPMLERRREKQRRVVAGNNTFAAVASIWLQKSGERRKATTQVRVSNWLEHDILPFIGNLPISEVKAADVIPLLQRMNNRNLGDSILRVKWLVGSVLKYAVATELAQTNPVDSIVLHDHGIFGRKTASHPSLVEPVAFGGLLRAIRGYTGHASTINALKLSPLVFVRPGELRHAEWGEVDLDRAVWTIPAAKMKMKVEHIVPLSRQAVEILRQQQLISGHGSYVFPSIRGKGRPMSENTVNAALRGLGYGPDTHVAHGFRASARTMLDQNLKQSVPVIELQLAHAVKDANGNAYNRTSFLPERLAMMQTWADYCDKLAVGGDVVQLHRGAA